MKMSSTANLPGEAQKVESSGKLHGEDVLTKLMVASMCFLVLGSMHCIFICPPWVLMLKDPTQRGQDKRLSAAQLTGRPRSCWSSIMRQELAELHVDIAGRCMNRV